MLDWKFIGETILTTSQGIPVTLKLVLVSLLISIPLAFGMAIVNLKQKSIWSKIFRIYISFVRSLPVLVIIFLLYYSLPLLLAALIKKMGLSYNIYDLNPMIYGYLVFSFISIPTLSEVFRSGLLSVPVIQKEAAQSVGMTKKQTYLYVILPQAVEAVLPVLCTFVTNLIKMTSLAFCMSIREITGQARVAAADSIRYVECYVVIFVMYLILCMGTERIFRYFEQRRQLCLR